VVEIYNSFEPLGQSDIKVFEEKIGHRLPEDYLQFLLKHNGGFCKPDFFKYKKGTSGEKYGGVGMFLGITDEKDQYAIFRYKIELQDEIPPNLLPIADDGVGNGLCISIYGDDIGRIYYRRHGINPSEGNVFFVANSFNELLESLHEYPEDDE
jgi:hypothetical protein